jgi:HAD superfamily hydrolase (TIGR01549 family)
MIKNIFLDAGGVILDEKLFEKQSSKVITALIKKYNKNYSIKNYWNDVEEAVYRYVPRVYDYVLYKNINDIENYKIAKIEYKNKIKSHNTLELMDGINNFLIEFSKEYEIGILGQYGKDFKTFLKDKNILQYFTFSEIQDDYNISKPDPRYFIKILKKCRCKANESIMVGDRIDKDIIPAKMIGMKTIRIKTGIHKNQEPRTFEEIPNITVKRLKEIKLEQIKTMDYFV